jgi:hypothetical protein
MSAASGTNAGHTPCKAQWIAKVFGVDASRVKSERRN